MVIEYREGRQQGQGPKGRQKHRGVLASLSKALRMAQGNGQGSPAVASSQTHRTSELQTSAASCTGKVAVPEGGRGSFKGPQLSCSRSQV